MAYEKTNWQTGDIVTAEKLNKLENGIEKSVVTDVVAHITFDSWENFAEGTADMTPSLLLSLIYDQTNQIYNKSAMVVLTFLSDVSTEPAHTFFAPLQGHGYSVESGNNLAFIEFETTYFTSAFSYPVSMNRIRVTGDINSNKWILETDEIYLQIEEE